MYDGAVVKLDLNLIGRTRKEFMKRMIRCEAVMVLLVLLASPGCPVYAEENGDSVYTENEWNYVEASLDISDGIPEDASGRLLAIREAGKLTVATEPYYAPQEFIDPDLSGQEKYQGADMELARRIAERMGVELEIVPLEFTEVLASVEDGLYDLAISGLAYTPGRAGKLELSKGYYFVDGEEANGLLVRKETLPAVRSLEDLKGWNIVAQKGSLQESLGAENILVYHEFRRVPSIGEVYDSLESGSSDAGIVDIENAEIYIRNNPDCDLAVVPGIRFSMDEQFKGDRVAAKKDEIMLICFVNGVIDEVVESGEYREWFEKYTAYAADLGL